MNDKVIVGTSGGDDGVRGFVAAYDANSGKMLWRFWTIPGPGEPGSSSWPGDLYLHGGGTTWMPGTYDPETNTLFWPTSNASPDFDGNVRPGDLFVIHAERVQEAARGGADQAFVDDRGAEAACGFIVGHGCR